MNMIIPSVVPVQVGRTTQILDVHRLDLMGLVYVQIATLELFLVKEQNHVHHVQLEHIINIQEEQVVLVFMFLVRIAELELIQLEERVCVLFVTLGTIRIKQDQLHVPAVQLEVIHPSQGQHHVPAVQLEDIQMFKVPHHVNIVQLEDIQMFKVPHLRRFVSHVQLELIQVQVRLHVPAVQLFITVLS